MNGGRTSMMPAVKYIHTLQTKVVSYTSQMGKKLGYTPVHKGRCSDVIGNPFTVGLPTVVAETSFICN